MAKQLCCCNTSGLKTFCECSLGNFEYYYVHFRRIAVLRNQNGSLIVSLPFIFVGVGKKIIFITLGSSKAER